MGGGPEALTHFWHSFNNFLVRRLYTAIRRILGGVGVGWGECAVTNRCPRIVSVCPSHLACPYHLIFLTCPATTVHRTPHSRGTL